MKIIKLHKTLPSSCCSVTKLCLTLCDPEYCSTPGFTVLHYLLKFVKLMSIESVMPSNHLILCRPLCLLPSIFSASGSFPVGLLFPSVQLLSCVWLCDPMDYSTPGFPVHHQLPELAQIHAHRVGDAIQPSHPLSSPFPSFDLSQHQGLSNESLLCIR